MLKTMIIAGSLVIAGAAFAQTAQAPNGTPGTAPAVDNDTMRTTTPMQQRNTSMPNNSTGNMNTKGAGKGTTGTGGPGGSGNE